jgi:hypothetical protein
VGLPGGDHHAVGGLDLGGEFAFGGADGFEVVAGGVTFAADGRWQPGAQLEGALLAREQGGLGEAVCVLQSLRWCSQMASRVILSKAGKC